KEILRVLLISVLFIVLSSRIEWNHLVNLGLPALGFVLLLILVVRPVAVLLSTIGAELSLKERLFLSWLAPRGIVAAAVSSIFVLEIQHLSKHSPDSEALQQLATESAILSPLVFLVIVGTVLVYGLTAQPVARLLGIGDPNPTGVLFVGADPITVEMASTLQSLGIPVLLVDSNYRKAAAARMQGLRASNHLITTEHVSDHLDLRGIGHLLAMTANDQVNSLAMIQLNETFDSSESFQLVPASSSQNGDKQMAGHLTGRLLFDKRATWNYLAERHAAGATIKKTPLTADFTWEDFQSMYSDSAIPLFVFLPESKRIKIIESENPRTLEPGMVLISLIDPPSSEEKA
ncbi:MAG: cation:proton antiporter, partial [Planctomycetaceae bacterium]|nr:cation:proton antiporter [Planctomycetaceae bacterium]